VDVYLYPDKLLRSAHANYSLRISWDETKNHCLSPYIKRSLKLFRVNKNWNVLTAFLQFRLISTQCQCCLHFPLNLHGALLKLLPFTSNLAQCFCAYVRKLKCLLRQIRHT
jgi:hypothetical protein